MSNTWEHYHHAARHHERAAYHFNEAAKYDEAEEHEKAMHHAYLAHGHGQLALDHSAQAVKLHATQCGKPALTVEQGSKEQTAA
jgi:hemin uptake protein HemP